MIHVNDHKIYSNLLIFKFKNYSLEYPEYIKELLKFSENTGKDKELERINTLGNCEYKNIFILGLGITEEFNDAKLFKCLGHAVRMLKNSIDDLDILDNFSEDFGYTLGESVQLALYKYSGIKKIEEKIKLQNVSILSKYKDSINNGLATGNSINIARQLTNMPSNYITPKYIAQQAENIAKDENLDFEIIDKYMLEQLGMNCIVDVCKGSTHSPRLVVMQYFGNPKSKNITCIIGKGVTFDSGGLSLKSKTGMGNMVSDMAGAASVLATMKIIGKIKPKKNILALIPLVENMPSGKSYKPGDVMVSYSGKTIEVVSTDAEGRLILCDAISYAKELGANTIIDVATLTGSCAHFLGNINIGLFSNSKELAQNIINCGRKVGENIWLMPNTEEYMDYLKSSAADIKNSSNECGAITAGMFLQSFCEDVPFAHLDIAGFSLNEKAKDCYDIGANGIPTRTLIKFLTE